MESEIDEKLISEFKQKHPGKHAIWRGKLTKQFEEWLNNRKEKKEKKGKTENKPSKNEGESIGKEIKILDEEIKTIDKEKGLEINAQINERLTILEQKVESLQSKQKELIEILEKMIALY